ncbi:uncharacterized protein LOC120760125 isoform X3 [Hirundo rustica]|uniref:uncharacterized protein LOC120760125 isoform X3 n=1 Tax=Hirundo rustica TaxID=43150 RepID=UPI001A93C7A1|nr:uncharacterized protein LOC120760125 isoform X3 [Hirundo rustica]
MGLGKKNTFFPQVEYSKQVKSETALLSLTHLQLIFSEERLTTNSTEKLSLSQHTRAGAFALGGFWRILMAFRGCEQRCGEILSFARKPRTELRSWIAPRVKRGSLSPPPPLIASHGGGCRSSC